MQTLAHYALLGSLLAGAAGAVIIATVTLKHGFKRAATEDDDEALEVTARRHRMIRLADTVAVLCFAVSAGLGVVGLMQHTRGTVAPPFASVDDGRLADRLQALEQQLAATQSALQSRASAAPEWRAVEERLARLENRLGAVEDRAVVAERRAISSEQLARERRDGRPRTAPAATAATPLRYVAPAAPAKTLPPPATLPAPSASLAPPSEAVVVGPDPAASIQTEPAPRPAPAATAAAAIPRAPVRPRVETPPPEPTLGEKLRRDWEAVKSGARRGGDEWRDGWDQVKRMFGY
jgi:hypothetical protein